MEHVRNVKRPLRKGEKFIVPCFVEYENGVRNPDFNIVHGEPVETPQDLMFITPVIDHPHNDKENGQHESHYHVDYRFVKHRNDSFFPTPINKHSRHVFAGTIRPNLKSGGVIKYFVLPVINEDFLGITPVGFIKNSKLKHKCIHKGKCPHRGYDLSQVESQDGIITCPLHGLKFNEKTKQIIP